jgi:hypothetical protein
MIATQSRYDRLPDAQPLLVRIGDYWFGPRSLKDGPNIEQGDRVFAAKAVKTVIVRCNMNT